jgi:hypothetical protein
MLYASTVASRASSYVAFLAFGALGLVPARAGAASPAEDAAARCVEDAEKGQKTRDTGSLIDARGRFVSCSAEACPGVVRRECIQWLTEVDARIPSLVISTRASDGRDLVGANVTVDGRPIPASALGRSLQLDPGPHRLEASLAGYGSRTESVVLVEREKGRALALVLSALPGAHVETARPRRSVPLLSWILGGVAVAGAGGFAFFWSRAMSDVSSLRESCAPYCAPGQIDEARDSVTLAHVSLGIGIAAAASAVLVYVLSSTSEAPRTAAAFRPSAAPSPPRF